MSRDNAGLVICPSCGENNPEGAPSCSSCGHGLEAWAPTQIARLPGTGVPSSGGSSEPTAGVPETSAAALSSISGNVIAGRYKIISQLGRGGVGVVYRAMDMELGEEIALKVLTISERDPQELDRVRREVKVARNITHPNVIRIYEFGTAGADAFISMQLLPGGTLAQRIDNGPMKIEDAIDISIGICDGLAAAHELGIVHRDIKPENVLFDAQGRPKVVDFGLARMANATTRTVGFSGTPFYMSPEQADGGEITVRSDVYSLGVLLFELFTGRLPFVADSLVRLAMMHVKDPPPMPRSIRSELPDEIEDMILRSLEKVPSKRYQSVNDLSGDLKSWREQAIGPYANPRTGDHPRPGKQPPPKRKTGDHPRAGDVTKTPILDDEDSRGRRVMPRESSIAETMPGVRPRGAEAGEETQIRSSPLGGETQISRLPGLDSPSRANRAMELPTATSFEPPRSRTPIYAAAAVGGVLFVGLLGAALSGAFSGESATKPTPIPTHVAVAAESKPAATATAVEAVTPMPTLAVETARRTATPRPTTTATPLATQTKVAIVQTPRPTPAAVRIVTLKVGVTKGCLGSKVFIEGQTVVKGGFSAAGSYTGNGGDLKIRVEHKNERSVFEGKIQKIDRSQDLDVNCDNGTVTSTTTKQSWRLPRR